MGKGFKVILGALLMAKNRLYSIVQSKFTYLLVSMLVLFLIAPLFEGRVIARGLLDIFTSVVLVSAVYAVSQKKGFFVIAVILVLPVLAGRWSGYLMDSSFLGFMGMSFGVLFLGFTATNIMANVFREEEVTTDTISGAICVYLLIGLAWAFLFSVIEYLHPGSFSFGQSIADTSGQPLDQQNTLFIYYSFVTLTTLGYGDVLPLTPSTRSLAMIEAVVGQIYLTVLVARLVGLHIVHSSEKNRER